MKLVTAADTAHNMPKRSVLDTSGARNNSGSTLELQNRFGETTAWVTVISTWTAKRATSCALYKHAVKLYTTAERSCRGLVGDDVRLALGRKRYPTPATVSMYWSAYTPSFLRSPWMQASTLRSRISGEYSPNCIKSIGRVTTTPAYSTNGAKTWYCMGVNLTVSPSSITTWWRRSTCKCSSWYGPCVFWS